MIFQVPFLAFWRLGRSADWWPLTHLQRKTCLPSFYRSIRVLGCTTRKSVRKVSRSKKIFLKQKMILKKNWDFFLFSQFSRFLCESWNFREFSTNFSIFSRIIFDFRNFEFESRIFFSEFGRLWGDFIFFSILIRFFLRFFQRGIFRNFILPEFLRF